MNGKYLAVDGTCPRCSFDLYKGKVLVDKDVSVVILGFDFDIQDFFREDLLTRSARAPMMYRNDIFLGLGTRYDSLLLLLLSFLFFIISPMITFFIFFSRTRQK